MRDRREVESAVMLLLIMVFSYCIYSLILWEPR